jgi:hypothetical protein
VCITLVAEGKPQLISDFWWQKESPGQNCLFCFKGVGEMASHPVSQGIRFLKVGE